nr:MAG TPA: hypothetical protein [Bacteriophage sp.]
MNAGIALVAMYLFNVFHLVVSVSPVLTKLKLYL